MQNNVRNASEIGEGCAHSETIDEIRDEDSFPKPTPRKRRRYGWGPLPTAFTLLLMGAPLLTGCNLSSLEQTLTGQSPAPTITSLSPTSGPAYTQVTMTGTNFGVSPGIIGFTDANTTNVTVTASFWSTTSIIFAVPPMPSGAQTSNVGVQTSTGLVPATPATFQVTLGTPTITAVAPGSGAAGAAVVIAGNYFGPTQGTVTFTDVNKVIVSAPIFSWTNTSIVVGVPTMPSGAQTATISLVTAAGTVLPTPASFKVTN